MIYQISYIFVFGIIHKFKTRLDLIKVFVNCHIIFFVYPCFRLIFLEKIIPDFFSEKLTELHQNNITIH